MKHPLLILAIATIATFTMGWFGHRVYSKSITQEKEPMPAVKPINKTDSPAHLMYDTLLAKKTDSVSLTIQEPDNNSAKPTVILASTVTDTLWSDEKEIILKTPDGSLDIRRRFIPSKKFGDFLITDKFKGKPVKILDYTTSKYGKLYKDGSKKAVEAGAVFAGRFAFASVDCGSGCFASTIIDLKTGNVYDGPHASTGYQYKINSRLLIVNPPQPDGYYTPCDYCEPELYVWTGKSFKKIE